MRYSTDLIDGPVDLPGRAVRLIGAGWGIGARDGHCDMGPTALRAGRLVRSLRESGVEVDWGTIVSSSTEEPTDPAATVSKLCARLAGEVDGAMGDGRLPVVLGGDHTCAIGTWGAVRRRLRSSGPLGLIWIDAHLDSHLPHTTPSQALHGMPMACLLGHGDPRLTQLFGPKPTLDPAHVCLIGARSFEPDEAALLMQLGVRVFSMQELRRRGLAAVFAEALGIVQTGTAGFGVSVDLDALDPEDAPGVGTPVAQGIRARALTAAFAALRGNPLLQAIEIAELNPVLDEGGYTAGHVVSLLDAALAPVEQVPAIELEQRYAAHIYQPLPVVITRGSGASVWDQAGNRYIDMLSAYSAQSFGHCNARLVRVLTEQANTLGVTSRAFHNTQLPLLMQRLCALTGQYQGIPVNTGLEAVEVALKAARRWAHKIKGVAADRAEIIACRNNFHGRSIAIVGMSSEPAYQEGFGPFPPGFKLIPFGDVEALAAAITPNTAAFLVEPIQGEAGIVLPPDGYLAHCAQLCARHNVLLICDEVQTGLGRTGKLFACQHESVQPDGIILGKALGGGLLPVSAFLGRCDVMQAFTPGSHGSTFGGNPLAARVALEALDILIEDRLAERSAWLGEHLLTRLQALKSPLIHAVRGRGLFAGVEFDPACVSARSVCERLLAHGVLSKETHDTVVRFAPPLTIAREELDRAVDIFAVVLRELERGLLAAA
jgi:ornithine--oxo-acid transaminase